MNRTDRTYRIGTRGSPLALKQVEEVLKALKRFYSPIKTAISKIDTYGDKDRSTPISQTDGSDFFTREIDEALLGGDIDFAVHSAKDMPDMVPGGLCVAAMTKSVDPYDALVSKDNLRLWELPYGAKIGTSSMRRKTQLKEYRDDFQIVDIRGNIGERLNLLDDSEQSASAKASAAGQAAVLKPQDSGPRAMDAIVIAAVGMVRLGMEDRITQRIPFSILKPHPLQGSLAVVTRAEDKALIGLISVIDNKETVRL